MQAFHNDPAIKTAYIDRVEAHRRAESILQGYGYWRDGKGCAVGCTVHHDDDAHIQYEKQLGIPSVIAHIQDRLFELMPNARSSRWPAEFLRAIPVGADLSLVWPRFAVWLLTDSQHGVIRYAQAEQQVAIEDVATLYRIVINGGSVDNKTWIAATGARTAARSAYAAYAAARAADASDDSEVAAAADAAEAVAAAAAAASARAADARQSAYAADAAEAAVAAADAIYDAQAGRAAAAATAAYAAEAAAAAADPIYAPHAARAAAADAYAEIMANQLLALLAAAPVPAPPLLQEEG